MVKTSEIPKQLYDLTPQKIKFTQHQSPASLNNQFRKTNKSEILTKILLSFLFILPLAENSNLNSSSNTDISEKEQIRFLQDSPQNSGQQADSTAAQKQQDSYTSLQNYYEDYPQVGVFSLKLNDTNVINNLQFTTQTKFDFYDEQRKNDFSLDLTNNLLKFLGSFYTSDLSSLSKNKDYLNYIKNSYKKRTILIGIDGMVKSCIDFNNLSAFKFLKENGSTSLRSRSTAESLSGPGWSSVLCSLPSKDTGIVNNEWKAPWVSEENKKNYKYFTPINGLDASFPCLFQELKSKKKSTLVNSKSANKNFTNYVYSSWSFFRDNLGNKAFPRSLDLHAECQIRTNNSYFEYINCDDYSLERTKNFLLQDFDFYFWYMGSLDVAGHTFSFCGSEYQSRVANVNSILMDFFEYLKALGLLDKINFIITSDHGADKSMLSHGKDKYDGNLLVPLFMMGPDFKKNYEIKNAVNAIDIAPTIMRLNGFPINELWTGKVINEAMINDGETLNQLIVQGPIVISTSEFICGRGLNSLIILLNALFLILIL